MAFKPPAYIPKKLNKSKNFSKYIIFIKFMANFNLFLYIRDRAVFPAFVRLCFATNNYRRLSGLIAFVCFRLRPVNKYVREWARSPSSQQFAKIANISRYCSWLGTPLYRPSLLLLLILRLPTLVHSSGRRWHSVM